MTGIDAAAGVWVGMTCPYLSDGTVTRAADAAEVSTLAAQNGATARVRPHLHTAARTTRARYRVSDTERETGHE